MILSKLIEEYIAVCKSPATVQHLRDMIPAVAEVGEVEAISPKQWKDMLQSWTKGGWRTKHHGKKCKDWKFLTHEKRKELNERYVISKGWSVSTVKNNFGKLKMAIRWAISEELCSRSVWDIVSIIPTDHIEGVVYDEVKPVEWKHVEATKPYLDARTWDIVLILWHTGMRTSEVLKMKSTDLECSRDVWIYRPDGHKTKKKVKEKVIAIGPKAVEILRKYYKDGYLFPWRDTHYALNLFRGKIRRAVGRAKCEYWHPHQIRHSRATIVNQHVGVEAAASILGNTIQTTHIYAERNQQLAIETARAIG